MRIGDPPEDDDKEDDDEDVAVASSAAADNGVTVARFDRLEEGFDADNDDNDEEEVVVDDVVVSVELGDTDRSASTLASVFDAIV